MKLGITFLFLVVACVADCSRILAIFSYPVQSHNMMFEPLMIGLARAGHSVDVISHFPPKKSVPGYNHISLKGTLHNLVNNITADYASIHGGVYQMMNFLCNREVKDLCGLLPLPQLQRVTNADTKYDVMITEILGSNCYLSVAHIMKIPFIGIVTNVVYPWVIDPVFGDANPSFIPSQLSTFTNEMSFFERVENMMIHVYSKFLFYYWDVTVSNPLARKYFDDLPPLNDIYNNISLVLANSHFSIHGVRPGTQAIVEVAGLHIDETQVLSEELERFLNSSKDGVVYFSMGTLVRSDTFQVKKILAIYESFSELTNYKVLWKGNLKDMPKPLPSNVKIVSWVPQYAILRHPKVKAFVTHGGAMGTQEAIHAGVPIIGIPFFFDQSSNVMGYVQRGFGVYLSYKDISKVSFSKALREVLSNPKYQSNAARYSRLFRDRPLSPMDEAIFWVEYVIRNGGEPLRSSGQHLNWFQYYLIDVGLFLLAITMLVIAVVFTFVKTVLHIIACKQSCELPVKDKFS
ncbi:UDP-glucosyltransferase 2-like isoform X1 [Neodiprion pinetum]|uniref:UDP-glucosyltransferase 2-like isoform X1 n=1 Tax=Neodiprion pinetum TaxID=441929 RepID=UPI001EE074D7|nr:UDP-glucosyltransferase 2-like isoform X1 [Neodiprion pinetum]